MWDSKIQKNINFQLIIIQKKNIRLLFNNQTSPNKLQINHFSC
jgi:hypothetical protein